MATSGAPQSMAAAQTTTGPHGTALHRTARQRTARQRTALHTQGER